MRRYKPEGGVIARERTDSLACGRATAVVVNIQPGRTDSICICSPREQIKEPIPSSRDRTTVHRTAPIIQQTDSLACGRATAGQTVHRTVCLDRPFESVSKAEKRHTGRCVSFLVGEDGFEPSKRYAADLQSVPFGHSGTPPYSFGSIGAGRRTRTPDLLITNQLLYQLSYTGVSNRTRRL